MSHPSPTTPVDNASLTAGDPWKFAVFATVVGAWNVDDAFCEGLLILCVDGAIYPNEVASATLRHDIPGLRNDLEEIATDERLCAIPAKQAFAEIWETTFPDDVNASNDYRFDITPPSLADRGCYVFAVGDGAQARILAARLDPDADHLDDALRDAKVSEVRITQGELQEIASAVSKFAEALEQAD